MSVADSGLEFGLQGLKARREAEARLFAVSGTQLRAVTRQQDPVLQLPVCAIRLELRKERDATPLSSRLTQTGVFGRPFQR